MRIAVVGSYGVGMTMRLLRLPVAGETLLGGEFSSGHGGKGSNQAVAAARLGAEVALLTCIGDDAMGRDARALWAEEGIDAAASRTVAGAATMVGMILVEPSGENRIAVAAGVLEQLRPADVEAFRAQLTTADVAVVSLEIPLDAAVAALRIAHAAGTRTLLNPAPAQPLPDDVWQHVDVVTPNRTEAAILLGHDPDSPQPSRTLAAALRDKGVDTVVVTLGADGAFVHDRTGARSIPAVAPRAVVDTTGAGDAFTGALAVELAAGRPTDDAVRFAARAGAHAVGISEVIPALPRRTDLDSPSPEGKP